MGNCCDFGTGGGSSGLYFETDPDKENEQRKQLYEARMYPLDEPSAFHQLHMSDELLEWIKEDEDLYTCQGDDIPQIGEKWKFERCVDQRHIPDHVYYEGYGHALESSDTINSMNPRWGNPMDKHRGPKRVVAFIRCFKELNADWISEAYKESDSESFFGNLVSQDLHLADLAMQFHWGDPVENYDIGWHADGANSALHMAISILGRRALHLSRKEEGHTVHWQNPGDFYIGTPFTVRHAVEYPKVTWENRVFAIQGRFLFPTKDKKERKSLANTRDALEHATKIINETQIIVPSLDQVKEVYSKLE